MYSFQFHLALLIVSEEIRNKLRPNSSMHARPKSIPESHSTVTPPSSMPVSPVTITIESPISPGPAQISEVETEVFLWPAEVENRLLDPGVVNDTQTQALLLTTLVRENSLSLSLLKLLFHSSQKPTRKLAESAFKYCDWIKFSQQACKLGFVMSGKEP